MVVRSATREIRLFFGIQFQNQRVQLRASYFASRVGAKCDFPGEFVGCSVPVLSAVKPGFSQGFLHFWPVPLAVCSAHATRCMAPAALYFASRTENRVVFRVARVGKSLGF